MKHYLIKTAVITAFLTALFQPAMANPKYWQGPEGEARSGQDREPGEGMRLALSLLDLSDAQKSQIEAIHEANKEAMQGDRDKLRASKKQVRELLEETAIDEAKVHQLSKEIAEMKANQMIQGAKIKQQVLAVLNESQREKLAFMKAHHQARMGERRPPRQE